MTISSNTAPNMERLKTGSARIGLLLNPMSGQLKKRREAILRAAEQIPNGIIRQASDAAGFVTAANQLLESGIDLLVIIAGDGTSHAVLGHLFVTVPETDWPMLMIVPGGTTNMTPLDLGMRGKPEKILYKLARYLQGADEPAPELVRRPVLRIEQNGQFTVYGMFFAAGLVARGVKFSRSSIKQTGITGGVFTFLVMMRSLAGMILGGNHGAWAPVTMTITRENGEQSQGRYLFALISALDCLLLNLRPYWGKEAAPLHITWVDQQRKKLWCAIWPLVTGRGHLLKAQDGYHSHNASTLALQLNDEYIVDGELYRSVDPDEPLRITATRPVSFLVL
jgi:diacylglycerol kinase (ATP)